MKKRRLVLDIETTGLNDNYALEDGEFTQSPDKIWCICVLDIDTGWRTSFGDDGFCDNPLSAFKDLLPEVKTLIAHFGLNFDFQVIKELLGIDFEIFVPETIEDAIQPDLLDGHRIMLVDTVIMSKLLNPDRYFGHSLAEWGYFLGNKKIDFNDWSKCSQEMVDYCFQDCEVTRDVFFYLHTKEWGTWNWMPAFNLEKCIADIIYRQSKQGFRFNQELAWENVNFLTGELERLRELVEPHLPPRTLNTGETKFYTPPKQIFTVEEFYAPKVQFKKNGDWSANFEKFIDTHYGEYDTQNRTITLYGKEYKLPIPTDVPVKVIKTPAVHAQNFLERMASVGIEVDLEALEGHSGDPIVTQVLMTMANQEDIKAYLLTMGWEPSNWKDKDLTINSKKQKIPFDEYLAKVDTYVEDTLGTPFEKARCEHLGVHPSKLRDFLRMKDTNKPVKVISNPSFTKDVEKNLDDSLVALGEQFEFVKDIVIWLTYRHRKNSILSDKGTGFLAHPRLQVDGKLPTPADTLGCNTSRFQHKVVANIPRVSSLFGKPMRAMFMADEDYWQIGCDADALEARMEGHYCFTYPEGDKHAALLVAAKPNDVHTSLARVLEISRDSAKTVGYALRYGASAPKIAKQLGVPLKEAERIFNMFWEAAKPLALFREDLLASWKKSGKTFIVSPDGRKLFTRSAHSILNTCFQHAGVLCMKRAMVLWDKWVKEEGLDTQQLIAYHDETQAQEHKDDVKIKTFADLEAANAWKFEWEQKTGHILSNVKKIDNNEFKVYYSRSGELSVKSILEAGRYYNLNVDLTSAYDIGANWAATH